MSGTSSPKAGRIVVAYKDRESSLAALRWAIGAAHAGTTALRVVHATDAGIAVRNGPSHVVSHQLGGPTWSTVHSLVQGLGAPLDTETIVKTGAAADVLARLVDAHDVVVLGKRRRFRLGRDLQSTLQSQRACAVIRVATIDGASTSPSTFRADPVGV